MADQLSYLSISYIVRYDAKIFAISTHIYPGWVGGTVPMSKLGIFKQVLQEGYFPKEKISLAPQPSGKFGSESKCI